MLKGLKDMTKQEFKKRWESDKNGGGITNTDIANCAIKWGITPRPCTMRMDVITYEVLRAANTDDYREFMPQELPF